MSVFNAALPGDAEKLAVCAHQMYVFYRCIKSFTVTKATLYWENKMWARDGNATIDHFETLNSPKPLEAHLSSWDLKFDWFYDSKSTSKLTLEAL